MTHSLELIGGTPVLVCTADGPPIRDGRDATDLVGEALSRGASWVAVPVARLGGDVLRSGVEAVTGVTAPGGRSSREAAAEAIARRFAEYRVGLAVVGDLGALTAGSTALRDMVRESNDGGRLWFVPDLVALAARLSG